ncbi:MAG: hypothetical protein Q7U54_00565 [Bacteroidales bacterium]|nr:hypothetical protein [Bacteroidales bacterium]
MTNKNLHVKLLLAFLLAVLPAAIFAQYIDGEFTITISSTTYSPEKKDHKDMTTGTNVIQGQVSGKIFRDRVDRYIKNPETRMTECNPSTNCPVFTCTSDNSVLRANYSSTPALKEYPLYVKKNSTSNGYKFVNINKGGQEKYVQTERFTASGENSVDKLNLYIIAYIAPSDQLAPLLPCYELQLNLGTPMYKLRERAFGEGEWLRWDDIKEKLVPVNEPIPIGVLAKVDPSRKMEDEIYEPLLIKNYKEFDEFMLNPEEKVFTIQTSAKRYLKSYSSEYESQIDVVIKLAPMGFLRKPQVALSGCSELGVGEQGQVTAKADKEGGTYSFRVEPEGIFTIESSGASATLRGTSAGRGTLYVEYTNPEGKTATSSQVAACVVLKSYNNGQAIPPIPLFDIDGKSLPGILKVPVETEPGEATDLLAFSASDPGIVTAIGLGDVVALQGIRSGKTTMQATTKCGGTAGPPVEVEVVYCDAETVARLAEMMRVAKEGQKEAAEEIGKITGSKEFEKAADEIAKSTYDLAEKTAKLIIGTLAGGSGASAAAKTAANIISSGSLLLSIVKGGDDAATQAYNAAKVLVKLSGDPMLKTAVSANETIDAATKFGNDLGTLLSTSERLKGATETYEQANRNVIRISGFQSICRKGTKPQPKQEQPTADIEKPKTNPTANPDAAPKQEPTKPNPPAEQNPVQEPQAENSPSGEDIYSDPEFTPAPPRQVGLPYEPGDCGCDKPQGLAANSGSFSTMQKGFENLQKCVDNFSSGPLAEYIKTLTDWKAVTDGLEKAVSATPAEFEVAAKETAPLIESLIERTKSFDEAGKVFLKQFDACPKSMEVGVEILNSVNEITVESLKINY